MSELISFYPSTDLAKTRDFYEGLLDLKLARDQGTCLIFKVTAGAYIGFCRHSSVPEYHSGLIITILEEDVDTLYAKLDKANVFLENAPQLNETFQIYHFFTRDPNGYRLEIQRFLQPLP